MFENQPQLIVKIYKFLQTAGTNSFLTEEWHEHFIRDVENREHRHDPNPDKLVDFIYE